MQKIHLVVTIVGPDRRGLVAEITETIVEHHASIEESRMSRLGGDFAIIMLVAIDAAQKEMCCAALEKLEDHGLEVFSRVTDLSRIEKFKGFVPYEVSVWGADHEGIVHHVAEYLAELRIQVDDMETHVTKAPVTGTPLFSMHAEVQSPPEISLPQLREKLEKLGDHLGVDIGVKLPMN